MVAKSKILLDTSFLIDLMKFKISLEEELTRLLEQSYDIVILPRIADEIKNIAGKGNKFAKAALRLLDLKKFEVLTTIHSGHTDDIIISLCKEDRGLIVATNDSELRKKLKNSGIKTIYIRAKKHLAID